MSTTGDKPVYVTQDIHAHPPLEPTPEDPWPQVAGCVACHLEELHRRRAHRDYEYATTEGPRKQWDDADVPPDGEGWERNTAAGRDGWDRFNYTEESYWRRLRPGGPLPPPPPPLHERVAALADAWDAEHKPHWCCTRGCMFPNGLHLTNPEQLLTVPRAAELDTEPCPGTCTCDIGPRVAALRALLNPPDEQPATTEEENRGTDQ